MSIPVRSPDSVHLEEGEPVSVAILDCVGFDGINKRHGREMGDAVLRHVYQALGSYTGAKGTRARVGGDEFMVAYPGASPEEALLTLEELRASLDCPQEISGVTLAVPLSIGIASFPHHTENVAQLPGLAEQAMHRAKSDGGNRIAIYVEERMQLKSSYYPRAQLARLTALANACGATEASILRDALTSYLESHRAVT